MADTRFRKFMMQGIMWLILGATVGGAALVDHIKNNALSVPLGPAMAFDDVTLSLPQGWEPLDASSDPQILVALRDPNLGDEIFVTREATTGGRLLERIPIGDRQGTLRLDVSHDNGESEVDLIASRPMPSGPPLTIMLSTDSTPQADALQAEIDLIKRVAATVKIHAGSDVPQT
jgi:hypothetical protein